RKDRSEQREANRDSGKGFDVTGLALLLHHLRANDREQRDEIQTRQHRVSDRDSQTGHKSIAKRQLVTIRQPFFFNSQHQSDNRAEIENSYVGKLRARAFEVKHKML